MGEVRGKETILLVLSGVLFDGRFILYYFVIQPDGIAGTEKKKVWISKVPLFA